MSNISNVVSNEALKLTDETLSAHQREVFDSYIDRINNIIESHQCFRMEIAEQVVLLKEELFGKGFDPSAYEERFVLLAVGKRLGFSPNTLVNWVNVFLTFRVVEGDTANKEYVDLGFHEKLRITNEIRVRKKKPTEALKEHFANKSDPLKKRLYYLERYVNSALSCSRNIEETPSLSLSNPQRVMLEDFKSKLGLTIEIVDKILTKKSSVILRRQK
jgi:hypothetical protein